MRQDFRGAVFGGSQGRKSLQQFEIIVQPGYDGLGEDGKMIFSDAGECFEPYCRLIVRLYKYALKVYEY